MPAGDGRGSTATLETEVEAFLAQYGNPRTFTSFRDALARFFKASGISTLPAFVGMDQWRLQEVIDGMGAEYKPGTIKVTCAVTKRFFRFLRKRRLTTGTTPFVDLDMPKTKNVPIENVLHPWEITAALQRAKKHPRDYAIILTLITHGWRVSELCTLDWGQPSDRINNIASDGRGGHIANIVAKGTKVIHTKLDPAVYAAAKAWAGKKTGASDAFIRWDDYRRLTRQDVWKLVKEHCNITPHGLRATFASKTIAEHGIEYARQVLHHESLTTTQRYSRWALEFTEHKK